MTLTFKRDLNGAKINQRAKYECQRLYSAKIIARIHRQSDRQKPDQVLYLDN